jgi:hypothetical protein
MNLSFGLRLIYKIIYRRIRSDPVVAAKSMILLVGAGRFERPTPCAQGRCATRLRYAPTVNYSPSLKHFRHPRPPALHFPVTIARISTQDPKRADGNQELGLCNLPGG